MIRARVSCPPFWSTLVLFCLCVATAPAEEPKNGDAMIDGYLAQETARLSGRFLDGAKTLEEWQAKRPRLRQEYFYMLGLSPMPEKTPLSATVTGRLERGDVVIEKVHFQSRPGLYVTGNLYRPSKVASKLPAILYVCGHSARGRDGNKTAYQEHGMWFASNGYVCLIIDSLQLGEIPGIHHGTYRFGRWWWQARGYTPAGVECWNGIRAIDYLVSRPEVDPQRIGVTGISGGGAATTWISAADERVKCSVPVSGMSDLESYVGHKVINGHCDCMFLVNTYQWEWTTILALIAPRPLLFCNSDHDTIFPMDGNQRVIARLRKLYQMYGKPEQVDAHVSPGGHAYRPDLRIAIFRWINKHLKGKTGNVRDVDFKPIPDHELRVFAADKDIPKDAINGKIDETFVPLADVKLPQPGHFEAWKKIMLAELSAKSFRTISEQIPATRSSLMDEVQSGWISTEQGIKVRLDAFPNKPKDSKHLAWFVLRPEDTDKGLIASWMHPFTTDASISFVPRGYLPTWTTKSPPNYVARAHALLGKTVDEGRVADIVTTLRRWKMEAMKEFKAGGPAAPIRLVGRGQTGILAAYAALFEPAVGEVVVVDPPSSHREGPNFLNVLRILDIPEALGMLAPRRLTLVNARDRAFDKTAQIYKLAGAEDRLTRK
jgi:dienelactone hydrolase